MKKSALILSTLFLIIASSANAKETVSRKPSAAPSYECSGDEPGWSLELTPTSATLTTQEKMSDPTHFQAPVLRSAEGVEPDFVMTYGLTTATTNVKASVVLLKAPCVDDADTSHDYTGVYMSPVHVYYGCCSKK